MRTKQWQRAIWTFVIALAGLVCSGQALADAVATDSAIAQPTGPEPPANGKAFLDLIGRDNATTVEFNSNDLSVGQISAADSLTLSLTQSPFSATSRGKLNFYVTGDTTTSIQFEDDAVFFDLSDIEGLNGQLAPLYELGHAKFHPVRNGWTDHFTFLIDPASDLEAYPVSQINSGGTLRLVIVPNADNRDGEEVGASYAGAANANMNFPPTLAVFAH